MSFKTTAQQFPPDPGIYIMRDKSGRIIYIGKAKHLKKRIKNYLQDPKTLSNKTQQLMKHAHSLDYIITSNEHEAFLLENTYIKKHQPKYNILLRDDKTFPFIFQSDHPFPRFSFYRGKVKSKGKHWGPYTHIIAVKETLDVLQKVFLLRNCSDSYFRHRSRPCLQYQIKRCSAPCVGYVDQTTYQSQVRSARLFLEGKTKHVIRILEEKMQQYSQDKLFEQAAIVRDQIHKICSITPQSQQNSQQDRYDIITVETNGFRLAYSWVSIVDNQVSHIDRHELEIIGKRSIEDYLQQLIIERFSHGPRSIIHIASQPNSSSKEDITDYLKNESGIIVKWKNPSKKWLQFSQNITLNLLTKPQNNDSHQLFFESLKHFLKLRSLPDRIECIDISHHQGQSTKGSCVVMDSAGMNPSLYRQFNLNTQQPGDDYEAIYETVKRRYRRLLEQNDLPDLIIIDGGKGQLKKAIEALNELDIDGLPLLGISKGPTRKPEDEKYYTTDDCNIVPIEIDSKLRQQLQHIRDEAHRFAIKAHRKSHTKSLTSSTLDDIKQLGPKRKQLLLSHFGNLANIQSACVSEISSLPGISSNMAKLIKQALSGDK